MSAKMKATETTSTAKRGQKRRRAVPLWRSRRALSVSVLVAVLVLTGSAGWAWHDGWFDRSATKLRAAVIDATLWAGLTVQDVLVSGRAETSRAELLNAVGLVRGAPILDFDVARAHQRVERLPWVRTASVRRVLPNTVVVDIVERHALALWQKDGAFKLIDHDGDVIADDDVARFGDLLVVVGQGASKQAAALIEVLDSRPDLKRRVSAAVWVGERRWNLHFDNGIDVRLPENETAAAWKRLAKYERTHRILARDVQVLDMRLPDRLIVRKPGGLRKPSSVGETQDKPNGPKSRKTNTKGTTKAVSGQET